MEAEKYKKKSVHSGRLLDELKSVVSATVVRNFKIYGEKMLKVGQYEHSSAPVAITRCLHIGITHTHCIHIH